MANLSPRSRLLQFVWITLALTGCASAVDDNDPPSPSGETTGNSSESLKVAPATEADAALDANAADCDAPAASAGAQTEAYREYRSLLEAADSSVDAAPAGNSCSAACRCCKWGNRFCCSHCKWCSGPIGVSTGVLAQ